MYKNFKIVWPADDSVQATDVSIFLDEGVMATIQYAMHLLEELQIMKHIALDVEGVLYNDSEVIACDEFTAMVFVDAVAISCVVGKKNFMTNALTMGDDGQLTDEDA